MCALNEVAPRERADRGRERDERRARPLGRRNRPCVETAAEAKTRTPASARMHTTGTTAAGVPRRKQKQLFRRHRTIPHVDEREHDEPNRVDEVPIEPDGPKRARRLVSAKVAREREAREESKRDEAQRDVERHGNPVRVKKVDVNRLLFTANPRSKSFAYSRACPPRKRRPRRGSRIIQARKARSVPRARPLPRSKG